MPPTMPAATAAAIEQLLHEQLTLLSENPEALSPEDIAIHMRCGVHPDGSMVYAWKGTAILRVEPQLLDDGAHTWRMFTRDEESERP